MYYPYTVDKNGVEHGSFEVFYLDYSDFAEPGYYWQAGHPECLPKTLLGPFETEEEAFADGQENT